MARNIDYVSVRGLSDEAIDNQLDLRDYVKVPVGFQQSDGSWVTMPDSAMVISPDGKPVSRVVSADYQIHQPRRLRQLFQDFAGESGLELVDIWRSPVALQARYALPQSQSVEITVGDTVASGMTLSTGFDGLAATWLQAWLERLVCLNGMRAYQDSAAFQIRHTAKLTDEVMSKAAGAIDRILATTGAHTGWIRQLADVEVSPELARAFFRLIAATGTDIRAAAKVQGRGSLDYGDVKGLLGELAKDESKPISFTDEDTVLPATSASRTMQSNYVASPGATPGTLAGLYHAVTRYESHDASGSRVSRAWSAMNDRGSQRIALASSILDGWMKTGVAA
jgi:hypothetical protein